jgi:hypothetical protein
MFWMINTLGLFTDKVLSSVVVSIGTDGAVLTSNSGYQEGNVIIDTTGFNRLRLAAVMSTPSWAYGGGWTRIQVYDGGNLIFSQDHVYDSLSIETELKVSSGQIQIKAFSSGSGGGASSVAIYNRKNYSCNKLLRNIRKTFVSGSVAEGWVNPWLRGCSIASPSTSYILALGDWYHGGGHYPVTVNCDGVVIKSQGYDMLELNISGGVVSDGDGWNSFVYVYESDSPTVFGSPPIYTRNFSTATDSFPMYIPLSRDYIKVQGYVVLGRWFHTGDITLFQPSLSRPLSISAKTPQNYPVYNALINITDADDNGVIGTVTTDANGNATFNIDMADHETVTIWGDKTINKSILNMTAKEISVLKEINVDT